MKQDAWPLCWVVALPIEARPLLDSHAFSRIADKPFPVYYAAKLNAHLIISGMGKVNSAAATAWLAAQLPSQQLWINLGTAGYKDGEIGDGYWIHKITDKATTKNYYPTVLPNWQTADILCCDQEEREADSPVDMESSGFFTTAGLFSYQELVHLYKLITDNEKHPPNRKRAADLLQQHDWSSVWQGVVELRRLASNQLDEEQQMNIKLAEWEEVLRQRFHFTTSRLIQLRRLLRNWAILHSGSPLKLQARDAAQLLEKLNIE